MSLHNTRNALSLLCKV